MFAPPLQIVVVLFQNIFPFKISKFCKKIPNIFPNAFFPSNFPTERVFYEKRLLGFSVSLKQESVHVCIRRFFVDFFWIILLISEASTVYSKHVQQASKPVLYT
jgi:hypothetical protein